MFAAKACGFKDIKVCVDDLSDEVHEALRCIMEDGQVLVALKEWKQALENVLKDEAIDRIIILLQGKQLVTGKVLQWLELKVGHMKQTMRIHLISEIDSAGDASMNEEGQETRRSKRQRGTQLGIFDNSYTLSHSQVGGVVDHTWRFGTSLRIAAPVLDALLRQSEVQADLQDCLDLTVSGKENSDLARAGRTIKYPWRQFSKRIVCPCVFVPGKLIRRQLTTSEVMDVYDIGAGDRNKMLSLTSVSPVSLCHALVKQIPTRVLVRSLEELIIKQDTGLGLASREMTLKLDQTEGYSVEEMEEMLQAKLIAASVPNRGASDECKQAMKNDDAMADVDQWNARVCDGLGLVYNKTRHGKALDVLREQVLMRWYRSFKTGVIGSFKKYMMREHGVDWQKILWGMTTKCKGGRKESQLVRDYEVGIDAIIRASRGSFWEWEDGSTVFFWRWQPFFRRNLRDGLPVWFRKRELPAFWGKQSWPSDPVEREKLVRKVEKVVERRYIVPGYVSSLTGFFAVPKGTDDIRVVYDATKSGLNEAIWVPNFFLPTMTTVLNCADETTYFGDIDLGEMFLNYFLDPRLRHKAGVDVTHLVQSTTDQEERPAKRLIMRWERSLMGVRSSPFNCVRIYLLSEDIIRGNRKDPNNPFRWDKVVTNLPGSKDYNPKKPWVMRWDSTSDRMASFVCSYVDDLRTGSQGGKRECDLVTHTVASKLNYLGQQDAPRKRGSASKTPGAWAGSVMESREGEGLFVSVSKEKWDKTKSIVNKYVELMDKRPNDTTKVNHKELEQDTGFLVHICMTYDNLRPYLKGFYLTLNGWRRDRNVAGWKRSKGDWEAEAEEMWESTSMSGMVMKRDEAQGTSKPDTVPQEVLMMELMKKDLRIWEMMLKQESPANRLIRGRRIGEVVYCFGDASGAGFGASWKKMGASAVEEGYGAEIHFRFGRWSERERDASSNFRELRNLVDTLEDAGKRRHLTGVEVFVFTDNSTAEAAFSRGSSSAETLYELVKRLKLMEMVYDTRIRVIHVVGKRMIAQGTDGLSRGCLLEGVMTGENMELFVPLHCTAFERAPEMWAWFREACPMPQGENLTLLSMSDWYERGHDIIGGDKNIDGAWIPRYGRGVYVWAPPPCIALQCMEELRKARHKRQVSTHIFVCPRLMTVEWRRHLFRSADLVISIPPGHPAWLSEQYEPLIVGFFFPYLSEEPWEFKCIPKFLGMGGHLQRVCKTDPVSSGSVLRQLWQYTRRLLPVSKQLVSQVLPRDGLATVSSAASRKRRRHCVEKDEG